MNKKKSGDRIFHFDGILWKCGFYHFFLEITELPLHIWEKEVYFITSIFEEFTSIIWPPQ